MARSYNRSMARGQVYVIDLAVDQGFGEPQAVLGVNVPVWRFGEGQGKFTRRDVLRSTFGSDEVESISVVSIWCPFLQGKAKT
jgi:hypothetical protein